MFGPDTRKGRLSYLADNLDAAASGVVLRDFLYEPFFSYQAERIVRRKYHARARDTKFSLLNAASPRVTTGVCRSH
jgi:hypothetical protein